MDSIESRISISIREGKIEISGSEDFVSTQIDNFRDLIDESLKIARQNPEDQNNQPAKPLTKDSTSDNTDNGSEESLQAYNDIFVEDEDKLNIVCEIPGNNDAEQTFNAALLYAYGRHLQGEETASVEEIRDVCIHHGFYQKKNFSAYIKKGHPKSYLDKGSRKSRVLKLNVPGTKEAEDLIEKVRSDGD